jgi:hypothetical protein
MSRRKISEQTSLPDLAALVSEALERAGITATLSGGAAVSIYSGNRYLSEDLDFVTAALVNELKHALEPLGFRHKGRPRLSVFEHPACRWYLEFPPAPLSFGGTYVDPSECALLDAGPGKLRIITPTHSVMDRLIAAAAWHDRQSLEQAMLVAEHQRDNIDWEKLSRWVEQEGLIENKEIVEFYKKTGKPLPPG